MMLVDANLLLYAYDPRSPRHQEAKSWLEAAFAGDDLVRIAWLTIWAFLRITTSARVFEHPLSIEEARHIVSRWLEQPSAGVLEPGERHWEILCRLAIQGQTAGPLVMDAVLAAIAIEHGARLQTTDRDFARFEGLDWTNPLENAS